MDIGHKTVFRIVRPAHHLVLAVEGGDRGNGAECLLTHDEAVVGHVLEHGGRVEQIAMLGAFATAHERRAFGECVGDVFLLLGHGFLVHQRADVRVVHAAPDGQRLGRFGEHLAEFVIDGTFDIDAVGAKAILPGCRPFGLHRLGNGLVQIAVLEHDHRGVAAQFHDQPLNGRRRLAVEEPAHFGRAGEGQGADAVVLRPRLDDGGRVAGDDVEHARRHARAFREFRQRERGIGGFVRRVRDDGAACGKRGGGLARQHRGGEVPRGDEGDDTDGFEPQLDLGVVEVAGHAFDVRALGLFGIELHERSGVVDFAPRFGDRLALLQHHDAGEILFVGEHQVEPAADDRGTLLRQGHGPIGKGHLRGVDGRTGILCGQLGDFAEEGAIGGVGDVERAAVRSRAPLAVHIGEAAQKPLVGDVHVGRDRCVEHLKPPVRWA